jgi:hypothetical protein
MPPKFVHPVTIIAHRPYERINMVESWITEFILRWEKYFPGANLPIVYFYTDCIDEELKKYSTFTERCLIGNLQQVRQGYPLVYDRQSPGCSGGKRYTGFSQKLRPKFEYFLSCGIEGELEGERYKQSPELVQEMLKGQPPFSAPGKYLVFKRLDELSPDDKPLAAVFFAGADVLSGLFTLANYDRADRHGVITPMGAGCASIVNFPLEEMNLEQPHCILGMFDVSARPHVQAQELTFAIPWKRLQQMASFMDESFLITTSWEKVRSRFLDMP